MTEKVLTGYPSIDKPWLKYYSEEAINAPLPEMTMYQYIWENNKDYLSDVSLRYYGAKITYSRLFDNIHRTARAFYAIGIRAGDIVTIMSMHTPETIYSIYVLNYLGAVANMVYMTLSENEIIETLRSTESKLFLVLDAALEKIEPLKGKIDIPVIVLNVSDSMPPHMKFGYSLKAKSQKHDFLQWQNFVKHGNGASIPPMATDNIAPAVIVYTSGTTGEPKGVMLSSNNFNSIAHQYKYSGILFDRGESILSFLPPFLSIGLSLNIHMPLSLGLVAEECIDPEPNNVARCFNKYKPNHFVAAPAYVTLIIETAAKHLEKVKTFAAGGDSVSIETERQINLWLKKGGSKAKYISGYGMTEFSATVTTSNNLANREGTMGIPLVNCNVKVVDEKTQQELSYNQTGELCFCSSSRMLGYLKGKRPCQDENATGWLNTGDFGYVDEDGFVYYVGRKKRMFPSKNGAGTLLKVYPQRIEEIFESQPYVHLCGVIAVPSANRLNAPVAFVEIKPEAHLIKEEAINALMELAQNELPEHMRPTVISILDLMPMTASGKIDYRALEKEAEAMYHA